MAALPSYVLVLVEGASEGFDPSVERTEMERGVPKQRIINTHVLMKLRATLRFTTAADAEAFLDWYFDTIGRIGTFEIVHPRTGAALSVSFEGGAIGDSIPLDGHYGHSQRSVVFEYLR